MKRIYLILLVLIGIATSCTKSFEDFNVDKKHPKLVPAAYLFANAQKAFADQEVNTNVNLNEFKQWAQYFTSTTYVDETNYNIVSRNVSSTVFRIYYRDILRDLKEVKDLLPGELAQLPAELAVRKNKELITDMMQVLVYSQLVDIFGDVPYSEAEDLNNLYPKYDDAFTIYKDLLARLDTDLAGLDAGYGSFDASDLYFGGDVAEWIKFGNSLKLRLGITLADVDNAIAKKAVEEAYTGAFGSGELCQLVYQGGANSNQLYLDLVNSGRHDFVPANTIVNIMNNLNDPRLFSYFTTKKFAYKRDDATGKLVDTKILGTGKIVLVYKGGDSLVHADLPFTALAVDTLNTFTYFSGGIYGKSNPFTQYSHISDPIQDAKYPCVILDNTELEFYMAEAAERGYSVGKTATEHYNAGIKNSILSWGGSQADVDAYLLRPDVAYATATGDWKQKIGTQAWLAYYVRGQVGFTSWRRLDYPILNLSPTIIDEYNNIPKRYTYPINEQTLNGASYTAAAAAIGGDKLTTKIFWDKN